MHRSSLPEWLEPGALVFSAKTFAAAMAALFIALWLGLERPSWAMTTAYIVASPLSGALTSKAAFRVVGTLLGATAAVALVPNLVNAPELSALALSAWVGFCLFISLLDRTPRSYMFMLAGYTAAIIGFPSVAAPSSIFDTALARVEEIMLGILCATLIGRVVFPRHVGPLVAHRVDVWLKDIGRVATDVFTGRAETSQFVRDQQKLAADAGELHGLFAHLAYDPSPLSGMTRQMEALEQRMVQLMPLIAAIADRLQALCANGKALPPQLAEVLASLCDWVAEGLDAPKEAAARIVAKLDAIEAAVKQPAWADLLLLGLTMRLRRFVELRTQCRQLWQEIRSGRIDASARQKLELEARPQLHRDHVGAAVSALAAFLATALCSAFWIATAWPDGATAAMMAAVGASMFASLDDPVRAIKNFTRNAIVSVGVAAIYLFAVLPQVDGFPVLVLALAPYFLIAGVLMSAPPTFAIGMPLAVNAAVLLGIEDRLNPDPAAYFNTGIAMITGLSLALAVIATLRGLSAEAAVRRLLAAIAADIVAACGQTAPSRELFVRRLIDRFGLLVRFASTDDERLAARNASRNVLIAIGADALHRQMSALPQSARAAVAALLHGISRRFATRSRTSRSHPVCRPADHGSLLSDLDAALGAALAMPRSLEQREMLTVLTGLRRSLFPDAAGYGENREDRCAMAWKEAG